MHYEAAGGVAYVLEGEAGHDGQDFASLCFEDADVAGVDDGE